MRAISHGDLRVELLDPKADVERLGARYVWGGYIWQVHHRLHGALLTGPEWPQAEPLPFNGQGLPESFRHKTRAGTPLTWSGDRGVAIGAGEIADSPLGPQVMTPCEWRARESACGMHYRTQQRAAGVEYELERSVELRGDTLLSTSRLTNLAREPLRLEWFAHPFFALTDGQIKLTLPPATTLRDNPGFTLERGTLRQKRRFAGKDDGHFDLIQLPPDAPLRCQIAHPRLRHIEFATSFVPSECVIWGNGNTFSIEPYLARTLVPSETFTWHLSYQFVSSS